MGTSNVNGVSTWSELTGIADTPYAIGEIEFRIEVGDISPLRSRCSHSIHKDFKLCHTVPEGTQIERSTERIGIDFPVFTSRDIEAVCKVWKGYISDSTCRSLSELGLG